MVEENISEIEFVKKLTDATDDNSKLLSPLGIREKIQKLEAPSE